ncbi:MAG TPA: sugar MFS transporter [Chitinophagaceae bacterium]|nr:sugar MFS transporter [Chitinophagaceae bacterium]
MESLIKPVIIEPVSQQKRFHFSFAVITGLFFIWGFITALNDILLPYLKKLFVLSYLQATLIQFAFFGAYFTGSLIYFITSIRYGDLIEKIGYKNCIITGLLIAAFGCCLFYPAASLKIFGVFLTGLFCLGLGFTLLQIAANPYVIILGSEKGASGRLNLAQGINSLGTTIAPLMGAYFLFSHYSSHTVAPGVFIIQHMYLVFALIFIGIAAIIKTISLPDFKSNAPMIKGAGALQYPHLIMGIIAIFTYVGGEVSIGSFMISFSKLPQITGLHESEGSKYVAMYWGGLMIGRFIGAISLDAKMRAYNKYVLMTCIPLISYIIIAQLTNQSTALYAGAFLILNLFAFFIGRFLPARSLGVFSVVLTGLILIAVFSSGTIALWALVGAGLFNSILWSNIFTLSLTGLGKYTSQGSSLLIMSILGAALIPVIQGAVADVAGLQRSFFIPVFCYLYLAFYGFRGYKLKRNS